MTLEQLMALTVNLDIAPDPGLGCGEELEGQGTLCHPTYAYRDRGPSQGSAGDDDGWLEDLALLDRLVTEKLQIEAAVLAAEGGQWIEVATDWPYGYSHCLRRLTE